MNTNIADLNKLIFQPRPDIVIEDFEEGALLLRLSDRRLIEINSGCRNLLNLSNGKRTIMQVVTHLSRQRKISIEQALKETLAFYDYLQTQGVLEKAPKISDKDIHNMPDPSVIKTRYLRNPDVVKREEDEDGALLFNPDTNQVKVINPTGVFIWDRCDRLNGLDEIVKALVEAFEEVPADQVAQDVQEFVDGMLQSGFIGSVK